MARLSDTVEGIVSASVRATITIVLLHVFTSEGNTFAEQSVKERISNGRILRCGQHVYDRSIPTGSSRMLLQSRSCAVSYSLSIENVRCYLESPERDETRRDHGMVRPVGCDFRALNGKSTA